MVVVPLPLLRTGRVRAESQWHLDPAEPPHQIRPGANVPRPRSVRLQHACVPVREYAFSARLTARRSVGSAPKKHGFLRAMQQALNVARCGGPSG